MEKLVNEGRFTVVNVGNNGDISKGAWHGIRLRLGRALDGALSDASGMKCRNAVSC